MSRLPVNHPTQPLLRLASGAIGLYILVFGAAGLAVTWGESFFARGDFWVLGLKTNPAFSLLSTAAGAVILGGAVYGRNLDHYINLWGSGVFLVAGVFMMALLRTELNLLNFSMTNCIVSFLIGLMLLWAGLYGRTGSRETEEAEDEFRRGWLGHRPPPELVAPPGYQGDPPAARAPARIGGSARSDGSADRRRQQSSPPPRDDRSSPRGRREEAERPEEDRAWWWR